MQSVKIVAYFLMSYFWLVGEEEEDEEFVDNKGFLSHS
jgi:hypothetical protein